MEYKIGDCIDFRSEHPDLYKAYLKDYQTAYTAYLEATKMIESGGRTFWESVNKLYPGAEKFIKHIDSNGKILFMGLDKGGDKIDS